MPPRDKVIAGLIDIVHGVASGRDATSTTVARLRAAADYLDGHAKGEARDLDAEILAVFTHWANTTGRAGRAKLSSARAAVIRARLREGFSVDQLKAVTEHVMQDDFYMGSNDRHRRYDWPETIFRNGARVETLLEQAGTPVVTESESGDTLTINLQRAAQKALAEGRIDEYQRIEHEIRNLPKP